MGRSIAFLSRRHTEAGLSCVDLVQAHEHIDPHHSSIYNFYSEINITDTGISKVSEDCSLSSSILKAATREQCQVPCLLMQGGS